MKILIAGLYNAYGGSTFTLLRLKEILMKDFDVTFRSPIKESDSKPDIFFPTYTLDSILKKVKVMKTFLELIRSEFNYLKRNRFDLILVNDNLSVLIYGLIAKILKIKVIWRVEHHEGSGVLKLIKNFFTHKKVYIANFMIPKEEKNAIVIRNALCIQRYKKTVKSNNLIKIYLVGSICDNKNQLFALKVFEKLFTINKNYRLIFIGNILNYDYFNKIKLEIKKNNLADYVTYEGFKDQKEIYSNADIILIASKFESFGLTFLEGLYNKIPVIVPDIESFNEIAQLIEYKALYKRNNIVDCSNLILKNSNIEVNFVDKIEHHFSLENMEYQLKELLKELIINEH